MPQLAAAQNTEEKAEDGLDVIVVTATRRSENQQDVPVAVQVLSEKQLDDLGVDSFEDYVALIPGVNTSGQGPGKQDIFIRGTSPSGSAVRIAGLGSEPSVSLYLDETPISTPGRNVDIYAADLSRVEALKGPQGTLFGASSQAGTLRLITNKPDTGEFLAGGKLSVSTTRGGESSNSVEGNINIPIVQDSLAFRLVAYNATQGGFIDNIPASRQIPLTNPGLGGVVPTTRGTATNTTVAEDDFNDATYRGFRASLLYEINDDWSVSAQYLDQTLETEGVFEFEPDVSTNEDLNVQTFTPDVGDDRISLGAWSVNGRVAGLDLVYNGSYSDRLFEGRTDYTGYANVGPFIPYYICSFPGYDSCGSPELITDSFFNTERLVQEFRISTDADNRWRLIAGVFYDDLKTTERTNFIYPASVGVGFAPNAPISTAFASDPTTREPGTTFFNDFVRDREELSFFGEFSFDILDNLTVTFGARNYSIEIGLTGQSSFGNRGVDADFGVNVDAILAGQTPTTLSDTIFKGNITWKPIEDVLLYATYSEGFRGGGFNRNGTGNGPNDVPFFFDTDDVVNYEFGWKTQLLDNRLRFNGAIYRVDFTDLQQGVLDFSISNVSFFSNVGTAQITGFELDAQFQPTDNLTLFGSFSYIDSELTDIPASLVNIAPIGSALPFAPKTQGVFGARYEQEVGSVTLFGQGLVEYTDSRFTSLVQAARFEVDSYTLVGLSAGVKQDQWSITAFVDNLGDALGQLTAGAPDNIFRVVPTRPRTIGLRVSFDL